MKIKDHPKMTGRLTGGTWFHPTTKASSTLPNDIGEWVLVEAQFIPASLSVQSVAVRMHLAKEGNEGQAFLLFDDADFAQKFCHKLNADCQGITIQDIGEGEIDF
jgi:hypothetical protein